MPPSRASDALPWDADGYVFVTRNRTPLDLANLEKAFKRTLKRAGLPPFHVVYDLRHSYATAFLAKGVPITWVAAQLGHAKPTTTLRYYAHWLPNVGQRYVGRLLAAGAGQEPEWDVTSTSHVAGAARSASRNHPEGLVSREGVEPSTY